MVEWGTVPHTPIAITTSGSKVQVCGSRALGTRRATEALGLHESHGSYLACLRPIAALRLASSATVNSIGITTRRSWSRQYRSGRSGLSASSLSSSSEAAPALSSWSRSYQNGAIFVNIEGFRPCLSKPSYRAPKWALMVRLMQKERLKSPQKSLIIENQAFWVILAILAKTAILVIWPAISEPGRTRRQKGPTGVLLKST